MEVVVEEAMAARIKVDMGDNRTATVAEAAEVVAAVDMVEVALIGVVVEVATEVAVEAAWAVVSEVVASINLVDHGTKAHVMILLVSRIILTITPSLSKDLVKM